MADTKIEWATKVWNPVVGCTHAGSRGCDHCYARELHTRRHKAYLKGKKMPKQYAKPFNEIQLLPDRLDIPLHWRKPQMVFVNSMSDLFHHDVPDSFICDILARMEFAKQHTFLILTKRPKIIRDFFKVWDSKSWPLPNVWLGVSVEDQQAADERIPILLQIPAVVRLVSVEPMLGPINLQSKILGDILCRCAGCMDYAKNCPDRWQAQRIDWVICGGETGSNARPMHPDWARSLRDQCSASGTPFFFKQWGEWIGSDQQLADGSEPVLSEGAIHKWLYSKPAGHPHFGMNYNIKVGKKIAGHLLDGQEWRQFPRLNKARL